MSVSITEHRLLSGLAGPRSSTHTARPGGRQYRGMPVGNGERRRRSPIRLVITTAMVVAIGVTAASCIFGRRGDAEDLDRHVRAMPGVADTDMTYVNSFTSGNASI